MDKREENLNKIEELGEKVLLGGGLSVKLDIDFTSQRGEVYKGTIELKRPTIGDYIKIGAEKAKYLKKQVLSGDTTVTIDVFDFDPNIRFLAEILATFNTLLVSCPKWFVKPENVVDVDVIYHVFDLYEDWIKNFRVSD